MPRGPETRYARAEDGSQIAYQVIGDGPLDLVYLSGSLSHVDVRWESPLNARFLERLATFSRLVTFDRRGVGASDRLPNNTVPTWEEWAEDLRVVLDVVDSKTAVPLAVGDGGAMAITFATMHPERVSALVLFNVLGNFGGESDGELSEELVDLVAGAQEELWGTQDWVKILTPSLADDPVHSVWLMKYMRATGTPKAIAAQTRATWGTDVSFVVPLIRVPTLVLHRTDYAGAGIDSGRCPRSC